MKWKVTLGSAAALLVVLSGCGTPPNEQPADPSASSTTAPPATSSSNAGETPVPAEQLDAAKLPEGYPRKAATTNGGKTLKITAEEGGCGKASAELKSETADRVVVNLVETTPSGGQACTMDIRYPVLSVDLKEPLEKRTLELTEEQRKS